MDRVHAERKSQGHGVWLGLNRFISQDLVRFAKLMTSEEPFNLHFDIYSEEITCWNPRQERTIVSREPIVGQKLEGYARPFQLQIYP